MSIWFTDKDNSPRAICKKLMEHNLKVKVYVGENLSYEDERICSGTAEEIYNMNFNNLSVVIIENENGADKI